MGTAPEQKDGKRQKWLENYVQATFLYKYFLFYFGKSKPLPYDTSKEIPCSNEFL